jgi:hydroxypyruvate reductase
VSGTESAHRASDSSRTVLRDDALTIFAAGVEAADPRNAVKKAIRLGLGGGVIVGRNEIAPPSTLRIVAVGKAACNMASAAMEVVSPAVFPGPGIAVVNEENAGEVERFRVLPTGHPLPDARGATAAREIEEYVSGARKNDGLLVLISGGGSALLPAPIAGLSLDETIAITKLLLKCGADIGEVNTVRKRLSRLKGGGLARLAYPQAVETLILSDVIGDDLSAIASGPTAADPTSFQMAREILDRHRIWKEIPAAARAHLERGRREEGDAPRPSNKIFANVRNRIVGSNALSLNSAIRRATDLGYAVEIASRELTGEAREAAAFLSRLSRAKQSPPDGKKPGAQRALLAGGETTVTLRGSGRGGRNQELALAFSIELERAGPHAEWVLLSAGTDGRDGPTDAAGAIVDSGTLERGKQAGLDPLQALANNDSYTFLEAAEDLLRTGATGTNVADLQVFLTGTRE